MTRERKKKQLKAFKGKQRMVEIEQEHAQKASDWQSFRAGKGAKKKSGFMSSTKKESIFKVPDSIDGKVGVVGSGKGLTSFADRAAVLPPGGAAAFRGISAADDNA